VAERRGTPHTNTTPAAERARIPPVARGHFRVIAVTSRARGCGGSVPDHVPVWSGLAAACACACAFAVSTACASLTARARVTPSNRRPKRWYKTKGVSPLTTCPYMPMLSLIVVARTGHHVTIFLATSGT
jgi:hypothetical protein